MDISDRIDMADVVDVTEGLRSLFKVITLRRLTFSIQGVLFDNVEETEEDGIGCFCCFLGRALLLLIIGVDVDFCNCI